MAGAYVGLSQTCSFDGTDLAASDANSGLLVKVTGALNAGSDGIDSVIPQVQKVSATTDRIYGVLLNVNVGANRCSVQKKGVTKVKSSAGAPVTGDLGSGLIAGTAGDGTPTAGEGRGTIVNYTGTGATDLLIVDLDLDAYHTT